MIWVTVLNYKRTDGWTYGWTDVWLGGLMDRQTTWEHIITGTLRWPGNNTFNVPISTFFIQFSDKPAAHFENGRHLENKNMAHLALNQKLLAILCSIIWPLKIQLFQLLNNFITNLPCYIFLLFLDQWNSDLMLMLERPLSHYWTSPLKYHIIKWAFSCSPDIYNYSNESSSIPYHYYEPKGMKECAYYNLSETRLDGGHLFITEKAVFRRWALTHRIMFK